ncbi:hypothetical protein ACFLTA_09790, partial [Bacteroidota bacterium]
LSGLSADFIISLNILNQLDILLIDYLDRFIKIPEDDKKKFRARIQKQHIDLLPAGGSCLISDVEERVLNRDNSLVSKKKLSYTKLPQGNRQDEWTWTFDTRGEYNKGYLTEMLVRAIQL